MSRQKILITGAASGIGRAVAERFAAAGADLCLNDLNADKLKLVFDALPAGNHLQLAGSYADPQTMAAGETLIRQHWNRIDVLVSCAGISEVTDPLTMTPDRWRQIFDTMVNGCLLITRLAATFMPDGGRIIHISSIHANRAEKGASSYSLAKAAINQFCRAMAVELAPRNILVNAIAPGFVNTAMSMVDGKNELESDWFRQNYIDGHHLPLRRAATPEEIAGVAFFLAGKDASYITGQVLTVDGGLTITFKMTIESIDFFYCSMPQVLDIGDGSQDALLVRIRANGYEGWGECEASPLTSIASYVCPMSHSACKPVSYSLVGRRLDSVADIQAISRSVKENSLDLLQADHTLSGIDIALYDLLGKQKGVPVFDLLGYSKPYPKLPYASQLFGDSPDESFRKAKQIREAGYTAMKFGWGPFGKDLAADIAHLQACREGIGNDALLMIDAGTAWVDNMQEAAKRLDALKAVNAYWLEEPFVNMALQPYHDLAQKPQQIPLAGGEGCNNYEQAMAMMDYAGISFIQIDAGRIGGITIAKRVVDKAVSKGIRYVNHTFTSHLALSASLQAYAGLEAEFISEYPVALKQLAIDITREKILPDVNGYIHVPDGPGLGMSVDKEKLQAYLVKASIVVNGKTLYETPVLD